jgi:ribose transport system substrate-binding protein
MFEKSIVRKGLVFASALGLVVTGTTSSTAADGTESAIANLNKSSFFQLSEAIVKAKKVPSSLKLKDGSTFKLNPKIAAKIKAGKPVIWVNSYGAKGIPNFSQQYGSGQAIGLRGAKRILPMVLKDVSPEGVSQDVKKQIAGIEAALNTGQMDCLSIQPLDAVSFTAITKKVMAKGIPVFTVGVTSAGNELSNFTLISPKEGKQAANIVIDWMKKNNKQLKVFAVSGGDPSASWAQGRMKGFIDQITAKVPGARFVNNAQNALTTSYEPAKTLDAYKAFLTGNPEVEFIQNVDIGSAHAARAIKEANLVGKTWVIGWNLSVEQLDAVDSGVQIAALDQAWPQQSGFGAVACAMFLKYGKVAPNVNALDPFTKERGTKEARDFLASLNK